MLKVEKVIVVIEQEKVKKLSQNTFHKSQNR